MGLTVQHHHSPVQAKTYARLTVFAAVFLAGRAAALLAAVLDVFLVAFLAAGADFLVLGWTTVARAMADCAAVLA
jgi:hypothetical protein